MRQNVSMPRMSAHVFLAYAEEDRQPVQAIYKDLRRTGVEAWMDKPPAPWSEEGIQPGERWDEVLRAKLRSSRLVLVFLSNRSIRKRGYCQREIRLSLGAAMESPTNVPFLVPVLLEPCEVPDVRADTTSLSDFQWYRLHERGPSELVAHVARLMGLHRETLRESPRLPAVLSPRPRKGNPAPLHTALNPFLSADLSAENYRAVLSSVARGIERHAYRVSILEHTVRAKPEVLSPTWEMANESTGIGNDLRSIKRLQSRMQSVLMVAHTVPTYNIMIQEDGYSRVQLQDFPAAVDGYLRDLPAFVHAGIHAHLYMDGTTGELGIGTVLRVRSLGELIWYTFGLFAADPKNLATRVGRCLWGPCGSLFIKSRSDHVFCSASCRSAHNANRTARASWDSA